ncbi:MAG: Kdo hydroxylase family protein [Gammaproteobacteria bacterium]|nr:Kdo hydroxylase family protein [Gammaproteobacteria bacterium]MBP9764101.1 Kdo hydroxylase family protein [Gammaproteobacteria bacterium]
MLNRLSRASWTEPFSMLEQKAALEAIENGEVLYLPQCAFPLNAAEQSVLAPTILKKHFKNVSFNPNNRSLKGVVDSEVALQAASMMERFFQNSRCLIEQIFASYKDRLEIGRTSYRPIEVIDRKTSLLKDDTRLHVDAFPATPNHGKRILRVFSNINPHQKPRMWHLGEPFEKVVLAFLPTLQKPLLGSRTLLAWAKMTKSYRTLYDHYMLQLHDAMKKSESYQQTVTKTTVSFPAGATWIVMTDAVSHAALSGQYLLEQTFYLPVEAMVCPQKSPLRILEKNLSRKLI